MSEIKWTEAPQSAIHIAEEIIKKFHPWLQEARIAFVMRSEGQKRGSRIVLGQACKIPEKMQPYMEFDFLIWLAEDAYTGMSNGEREALIDHELSHCRKNFVTDGWKLAEHDIQEFAVIISRHGLWTEDLRRMDKAVDSYRQETLPNLMDHTLDKVTMSSEGRVVTVTGAQLERLANSLGGKA